MELVEKLEAKILEKGFWKGDFINLTEPYTNTKLNTLLNEIEKTGV